MKKVVIGGFHHESDTFNPIVTGRDDITVKRGSELLLPYSGGENALSGIVASLIDSVELVPTLFARAVPNGEWDKEYYLELKAEFLSLVEEAFPFSAFALALHGSMRVKEIGDAEADILLTLKTLYPDIPIFSSLDTHATISKEMVNNSDCLISYKCAPHTATFEIGKKVGHLVLDYLKSRNLPKIAVFKIPFLVAGEQSETSTEPMKSLMAQFIALENVDKNIIAASYTLGFPWADTKDNGCAVIVLSNELKVAEEKALELAKLFWQKRTEFSFCYDTFLPEKALKEALKSVSNGVFPVVISDSGDNPTAGSSQDVTNFLQLILKCEELKSLAPPLCYQAFYDSELLYEAFKVGKGGVVKGSLGAKFDKKMSESIEITATVKALSKEYDKANLALLNFKGVDIVLTDKHVGCYECDMLRCLGIKPEELKVLVVKLGYLEPELKAIAKNSIIALTTGSSDELFTRLNYEKLCRPIYPFDKEMVFKPVLLLQ